MRVEDLDGPRVRRGMEARILDELSWLGLDWDEVRTSAGRAGPTASRSASRATPPGSSGSAPMAARTHVLLARGDRRREPGAARSVRRRPPLPGDLPRPVRRRARGPRAARPAAAWRFRAEPVPSPSTTACTARRRRRRTPPWATSSSRARRRGLLPARGRGGRRGHAGRRTSCAATIFSPPRRASSCSTARSGSRRRGSRTSRSCRRGRRAAREAARRALARRAARARRRAGGRGRAPRRAVRPRRPGAALPPAELVQGFSLWRVPRGPVTLAAARVAALLGES